MKILHLDDEPEWRKIVSRMIGHLGHECVAVGTFNEGKHIIEFDNVALAILDVRLEHNEPGNQDGIEFAEWLANSIYKTKALMLSGYMTAERKRHIFNAFGDRNRVDVLEKANFSAQELTKVITTLMEKTDENGA